MKANLQILNTGLDHMYVNGVPIVEAEITISDIYKKVARVSSLAVMADPYFNKATNAQKLFSELHGEGDRITKEFLEEGAREVLPVFQSLQKWIPEGVYDAKNVDYSFTEQTGNFQWTNPKYPGGNTILSIKVCCTNGGADVTFKVNSIELGTVTLPEVVGGDEEYFTYDLSAWLGGNGISFANYCYLKNLRNENLPELIELELSNDSPDFEYNVIISTIEYDGITWVKLLANSSDIKVPTVRDNILVNYLYQTFLWANVAELRVYGVTINKLAGNAYVTVNTNLGAGTQYYLGATSAGEDFTEETSPITSVEVVVEDATEDFRYALVIHIGVPDLIPSPRFEFDSSWNAGKIIYRWQNMDTREADSKLDYTSNTFFDKRIDTNTFDNVRKYLKDALEDYVLMQLYKTIGYERKYKEYSKSYELNRQYVAYWVKQDTSLII